MRILYIILAHDNPDGLFEMASTVSAAATDSDVLIHFDAAANQTDTNRLKLLIADQERIKLVDDPVRCRWGTFSLVAATLLSLKQAIQKSSGYNYVILLSGSCRPSRPIADFENYLKDHQGLEFIESRDVDWITDGLKHERYHLYFPFGASKNYSNYLRPWTKLQRILGIKRKVPNNIDVKFGSQWWCLTWDTCVKLISYLDMNSDILNFFKNTYIPDEMFFQTVVNRIVDSSKVSGRNLTYYQFDKSGKPLLFDDNSVPVTYQADKFFFRKIGKNSSELHDRCLRIAARRAFTPDAMQKKLDESQTPTNRSKLTAGELFRRDQFSDHAASVLGRNRIPYVFIIAPILKIQSLASRMDDENFQNMGRLLSNNEVFEDAKFDELKGLKKTDKAIRDLHPALYMCRAISRSEKVPILFWCFEDNRNILPEIFCDKNALKISFYNVEELTYALPSCRLELPCIFAKNGVIEEYSACEDFLQYEWITPLIKQINGINSDPI